MPKKFTENWLAIPATTRNEVANKISAVRDICLSKPFNRQMTKLAKVIQADGVRSEFTVGSVEALQSVIGCCYDLQASKAMDILEEIDQLLDGHELSCF